MLLTKKGHFRSRGHHKQDYRCQNVRSQGKIGKARSRRGMTGDGALKLVWGQIGESLEDHARFLF